MGCYFSYGEDFYDDYPTLALASAGEDRLRGKKLLGACCCAGLPEAVEALTDVPRIFPGLECRVQLSSSRGVVNAIAAQLVPSSLEVSCRLLRYRP